jgi:hypothetical protein
MLYNTALKKTVNSFQKLVPLILIAYSLIGSEPPLQSFTLFPLAYFKVRTLRPWLENIYASLDL